MASREKYYVITMAFRMACFISMFFVHGWLRWVVLGGAVFLPFIAVLFANQANTKDEVSTVEQGAPAPAPQLTAGDPAAEVIEGELVGNDDLSDPTPANHPRPDDDQWTRHDRVA
jgi:hypothetical protein